MIKNQKVFKKKSQLANGSHPTPSFVALCMTMAGGPRETNPCSPDWFMPKLGIGWGNFVAKNLRVAGIFYHANFDSTW